MSLARTYNSPTELELTSYIHCENHKINPKIQTKQKATWVDAAKSFSVLILTKQNSLENILLPQLLEAWSTTFGLFRPQTKSPTMDNIT